MTAKQYMDSIVGKGIDFDNLYGNQCVDIIKKYFVDVIGIPAIRNNAIDYWTNFPTAHFTKIVNTPSFVPQRGDIGIFGTKVGPWGHICIIDSANVNTFVSVDQNWPSEGYYDKNGNFIGTGKPHYQSHNYTGFLGVLRPKKDVNFDQAAFDAAEKARKEAEEIARKAKEEADRKAAEEIARLAKEEADRLAAEKAEADRIAKEKAIAEKAEQERIAKEQSKLEEELKKKIEAEEALENVIKGVNMNFIKSFWVNHKVAILTGLLRVLRGAVALAVSLVIAEVAKEPSLVALTPVLLGIDKAVREWGN